MIKIGDCHKVLLIFFSLMMTYVVEAQERNIFTLHNNWKFKKGNPENASAVNFDAVDWEDISVPHDWAISGPFIVNGDGDTGKLPWKGEGWYRKELDIPASYKNKRVYLIFDGVMAFPKIYVNGSLVGEWDYGYNSFYFDITDFLSFTGKNILAVHADTREHDSRWYPGAGIYRKVQMVVLNPIHSEIWSTHITTPIIKPHYADIRILTSVKNQLSTDEEVKVEQSVYNPKGSKVSQGNVAGIIKGGKNKDLEVTLNVIDPELWDIEAPNLYRAETKIFQNEKLVDSFSTSFGIRSLRFTSDNGFYLNGRRVQLKGVNLHHGHGPLGAAFYPRAMERQLEIMQSMGANAVRNGHNTAAPEFLELCDKMGILVFNEIFDKYDAKANITRETDFDEFAHRNVKNFVTRDRNHPSVFLWSVGNEIRDVQMNIDNGFKKLHTMVNYVRKYDPTRPVTLVNDMMESAALRHFDYYDVHSWNYGRRYRLARQLEPNKAVVISESASAVSTRGFYEFPLPEKPTDFTESLQVSSYDLNALGWGEIPDDNFMWQQEENYITGEFVWTGFDYLGEPPPYTNRSVIEMGMTDKEASRSSYFGIVDLVGIPKDRYYLYKSYWKPEENTIHILPHWNWKGREGDITPVFVYTNGDCAELFINGESQGKKCKKPTSKNSTERFRLKWTETKYQPGEIKAVAYKAGQIIGESSIQTAGKPYKLRLTPDRKIINADGLDLSYILVEAIDKNGNLCPLADNRINIQLNGSGTLAGVGNGNPQSFESFQANYVDLFYGKAMIILSAGMERGEAEITVESKNLEKDTVRIKMNEF